MADRKNPQPEPWGEDPEASRLAFHEEQYQAGTSWTRGEDVKVRKWVETGPFHDEVERNVGSIETDYEPAEPADDGQVHELSDGTLSIPIFEEQIVVTRRTVVRERLLLRRQVVAETVEINEEVRREEFELSTEEGEPIEVQHPRGHATPFPGSAADPRRKPG